MINVEEEELIEEIIKKLNILGFKNPTIENITYLRRIDIESLYQHKLGEYSSPLYFKDERLELKKAYVFLKSLFEKSHVSELGDILSPEYRPNLQVAVMDAIRESEMIEKNVINEQSKIDAKEYNKAMEALDAEKISATSEHYINKKIIEEQIKETKKTERKKKKAKKPWFKFW
jgi:hypothetical protein